jgi:hypothetical protein
MASTGVFVHKNCALKRFLSSSLKKSMILTYLALRKGLSHQKMGPERDFCDGRQRTEETERKLILLEYLIGSIEYLDD